MLCRHPCIKIDHVRVGDHVSKGKFCFERQVQSPALRDGDVLAQRFRVCVSTKFDLCRRSMTRENQAP